MQNATPQYTAAEEMIHAGSHGAGLALSIAGLWWMLYLSVAVADPWRIIASCVYGLSLVALFLASTLYHGLHSSPRKPVLKILDHCTIYLLIAGTCTPFLLVAMRTDIRWWLFGAIWSLAAIGIVTKLCHGHRFPRLSLASYLLMGWLMIIVTPQLVDVIGRDGMAWVIAGGLCYTLGAIFYIAKRIRFTHAVWHFFVLAGSACHFVAIVRYVLPFSQTFSADA